MSLPETAETAARPATKRSAAVDIKTLLALATAAVAAVGGYYTLRTQVADAQSVNDEKHRGYEARLGTLETDTSGIKSDLAVLKYQSQQNLDAQRSMNAKLDQLLSQKH